MGVAPRLGGECAEFRFGIPELTTPLNNASMVVPVGENGSWFISSKFFVHDARMKAVLISIMTFFFIKLYFFDTGHGLFDKLRNPKVVDPVETPQSRVTLLFI